MSEFEAVVDFVQDRGPASTWSAADWSEWRRLNTAALAALRRKEVPDGIGRRIMAVEGR